MMARASLGFAPLYMWREMDKAVFRAALPPILSAVKVSGDGGIRLQLDIPECDEAEALRLLLWRERVLVVTIEPEPRQGMGMETDDRVVGRRTAKQRV